MTSGSAQEIQPEVGQRLLGQALAGQGELNDRNRRGVVVEDERRHAAGRHLPQQRLRDRGDLRVGDADVGARLEENLDDAEAGVGVASMCSMSLTVVVSARWNCVTMRPAICSGGKAGILPDRRDHRDADFRKDVDRRAPRRERADDEKQQGEDDKSVRAPQRDADERSHLRCRSPVQCQASGIAAPWTGHSRRPRSENPVMCSAA